MMDIFGSDTKIELQARKGRKTNRMKKVLEIPTQSKRSMEADYTSVKGRDKRIFYITKYIQEM